MYDFIFGFGILFLFTILIAVFSVSSYDKGLEKGKCIGMYGTGSTHEDGQCFLPAKQ